MFKIIEVAADYEYGQLFVFDSKEHVKQQTFIA